MKVRILLLALATAGCAAPSSVEPNAAAALRPYYRQLDVTLPALPPGPALDTAQPLTRIAFGSCSHQERSQTHWDVVAASKPQLFLALGDNVYGDVRRAAGGSMNLPRARST